MSLPNAKILDVQFNRGLRQDLEETLAPPGALMRADNVEFDKSARLVKRDPYSAVSVSTVSKLNTFVGPVRRFAEGANGEQLLFTDENTHLRFGALGVSEAGQYGQYSTLRATLTERFNVGADQSGRYAWCDSCTVGNWLVITYAQLRPETASTYDMLVDVIDKTTKAKALTTNYSSPVVLQGVRSDVQGKLLVVGTTVFFFAAQGTGATSSIGYATLNLSSSTTVPNPVNPVSALVSDADGTLPIFDVDVTVGGFVIAYRAKTGGTLKVKAAIYDSTATAIFGPYVWLSGGAVWTCTAIGVLGASTNTQQIFFLGWNAFGAGDQMEILTTDYQLNIVQLTFNGKPTGMAANYDIQQITMTRLSTTTAGVICAGTHAFLNTDTTGPRGPIFLAKLVGSTAVWTNITPAFANYCLASKPFVDANGNIYAWARFNAESADQGMSHYLLLDFFGNTDQVFQRPTPCLHVAEGLAPAFTANTNPGLTSFTDLGSGKWLFTAVVNIGGSLLDGQQIGCFVGDVLGPKRFLNTVAHRTLFVAGGTPLAYDGQRLVELSFYSYPVASTPAKSGSGSFTAGLYRYRFVYEWTDASGNRHQSPASPEVSVTLTGLESTITLEVATLHATRKQVMQGSVTGRYDVQAPVRIVPYRANPQSVNDVGADGITFHRCSKAIVNLISQDLTANITIVQNTVTVTDTDLSVSANEILYTSTGTNGGGLGKLSSQAPPPCSFMAVHNGRLWGIDAENPERIWATKVFEDGEAPGYNPALQVIVPGCGKVNGVGGQDDKLYVFGLLGTYIGFYGPGPDNTGNGIFPDPVLLCTSSPCDDPRGIIISTSGIYFTGPDHWGTGVYLLRRGDGAPMSIGIRCRDELATNSIIRGAVERINKSRVEFLFVNSDTAPTSAGVLYYHPDLLDEEQAGQWTQSKFYDSRALECIGAWADVSLVGGVSGSTDYASIQSGTSTVGGNAVIGTDLGHPFAYDVITGDLRPFGLSSMGDVHSLTLVATGRTRAGYLTVAASYDARLTYEESLSTNTTETGGSPIARRWEMARKKLPFGFVAYRFYETTTFSGGSVGNLYTDGPILHGFSLELIPMAGQIRLADVARTNQTPTFVPVGTSAVVQTGGGVAATLSGTPTSFGSGLITVTGTGGDGVGTFDWSFLGQSASGVLKAAGAMALGTTGVSVTFAAGSITNATTYAWSAV